MGCVKEKGQEVWIFTHEFYPKKGGIAIFVQELAKAVGDLGYEVTVFAPGDNGLKEKEFGYKVVSLNHKGRQGWGCRLVSLREVFERRDQLKEVYLILAEPGPIRAYLYAQFFSVFNPKKLYLSFHGSDINIMTKRGYRERLLRRLIQKSERILVISEYCREKLINLFPESEEKVIYRRGGLRTDIVYKERVKKEEKDKLVLLAVGRIHPRKGQLTVLKALRELPEGIKSKVVYNVYGQVVREDYYRKMVKLARGEGIDFNYCGEVSEEELGAVYGGGDIFIMTSEPYRESVEGFGLVYLEASAAGLPVIAHKIGGVSSAVIEGETGLLVEPGDLEQLKEALIKLIRDKNLRNELGKKGRLEAYKSNWGDVALGFLGG